MKPARGALRKNIPGYAGGGLIDGFKRAVGLAPAETMREKFARQDAERATKQAPAVPKPVAVPEGQTAVTSYASGTLTGDRKKQMEDAIGKKAGGPITNIRPGGAIRGPGTGTSDDVPLMGSNGEFMIKASSVKKIGIEALEALNAVGDQPDEKDSKAEAKAEYGMKCGGAVRKMADGGLVPPVPTTPAITPAPAVAPVAAPAVAPVAATPTMKTPQFYSPGSAQDPHASAGMPTGVAEKAPVPGAITPESAAGLPKGALRTPSLATPTQPAPATSIGIPAIGAPAAAPQPATAPPVLKFAGGGLVTDEEKRAALVNQIPTGGSGTGPTPTASQPTPGDGQMSYGDQMRNLGGALASVPATALKTLVSAPGYGMNSPAAAPATPQPTPQATAAVAPPAGAVRPPAVPVAPAPVAPPVAPPVAAAPAQPAFDPLAAKAERDAQTQKDIALGNQMETTRKASEAEGYAAQDRGIDTSIAIAAKVDAERARQRAENTLSSTTDNAATRTQKVAAAQALAALDGQQAQTAGNEAAARRTNQADQTQRRGQDIQASGQAVQAGALRANQRLAQDKFAQDSKGAAIDQQGKVQIQALQSALLAEQDPAKRQLIEDNLRAVQGKYEKAAPAQKYTVYNLPDTVDANGQVVRGGQGALDAEGRPIDIQPPKASPKYEAGKVYTDAKGNRAKWDGKNFVPA